MGWRVEGGDQGWAGQAEGKAGETPRQESEEPLRNGLACAAGKENEKKTGCRGEASRLTGAGTCEQCLGIGFYLKIIAESLKGFKPKSYII